MRLHLQNVVLLCGTLMAATTAQASTVIYDVDAWIDTTDYLIIHNNTLQLEHKTSGSPAGTHLGPQPTVISSSLDGTPQMFNVQWNQTWPSPLPSDTFSSTFTPLTPTLVGTTDTTASVTKISGRGTPSIFQQPTAANDYTLIVQFTDGFSGAEFLDAQITVIPEPTSLSLLGITGLVIFLRRRRAT